MVQVSGRIERKRKRVVVVDDSRTMQAVLEQIFALRLGLEVVGMASDARSAAALVRSLRPDLVTIDLCMPYIDGRELLAQIADLTEVRKVIVSGQACDNLAMVSSLKAAGADDCIDKKDLSRDPAKFCNRMLAILAKPAAGGRERRPAAAEVAAREAATNVYPIPIDEKARLAALVDLDLANDVADRQLDLLTAHLGATTDYPVCLVTFIDRDKQWLKSAHGLARGAMPRAMAFCNYTLCAGDTFIVTNAATDPRFAANALVTGDPRIRTYVGQPIVDGAGVNLGAICLIDTRPRIVTPDVIANLHGISRIAAEFIVARTGKLARAA